MPETTQTIAQEIYKRNRELLQERRRAEDLLYNVSEGVFAVDKSFRITIFNNTIAKMLNIPEDVASGKMIDEVINIQTEKGDKIDLKEYCFTEPKKALELSDVILKAPEKDFFVNVKFSVIQSQTNDDDSECLITISDITKEIMLDKAKDDFLTLASHELKTPMTIIKSYLWMLNNDQAGNLSETQKSYIDRAANGTETMISMINDMLNISKMDQGKLSFKMKPGKIITTIQESITGFDLKAQEKNIYFKIDFSSVPIDQDAYYDDAKIKECLINLVGNSIKFTKKGGVTLLVENSEEFIKILVIDTGVGISTEDKKKLFQKFGKGEGSYNKIEGTGGTGLGLYIVKMYVEAMGGTIGYSSDGDFKGTTFWFTIPKFTKIHD